MKALGEVNLRSIRVGERLLLDGAELRDPSGMASGCSRPGHRGRVLRPHDRGRPVKLAGATVGAKVGFKEARVTYPAGTAIDTGGLRARSFTWSQGRWSRAALTSATRSSASCAMIRPPGLTACPWTGTYQGLDPRLPAPGDCHGSPGIGGHQSRPYEQLAAYCNAMAGRPRPAPCCIPESRSSGRGKAPYSRASLPAAGHHRGLRVPAPARARVARAPAHRREHRVSVVPPPALQAGTAPHFNGIIYTLDLMLPIVNLGQKYAFNPGSAEQWLSYVLIAAGWTLATTVTAGIARVLRRG